VKHSRQAGNIAIRTLTKQQLLKFIKVVWATVQSTWKFLTTKYFQPKAVVIFYLLSCAVHFAATVGRKLLLTRKTLRSAHSRLCRMARIWKACFVFTFQRSWLAGYQVLYLVRSHRLILQPHHTDPVARFSSSEI